MNNFTSSNSMASSSDSSESLSERSDSSTSYEIDAVEGEENYGFVDLEANAPYQHEPLAVASQPPLIGFEEDPNGIPHNILAEGQE